MTQDIAALQVQRNEAVLYRLRQEAERLGRAEQCSSVDVMLWGLICQIRSS